MLFQIFILPSVVGMLWMLKLSADALQYTTAIIYGLALFFLFTVSTTFHMISYTGRFRWYIQYGNYRDRMLSISGGIVCKSQNWDFEMKEIQFSANDYKPL